MFVPISNAVRQVSESYHRNQPEEEAGNFDMENYPYYAFKSLATLCTTQENQTICGLPILAVIELIAAAALVLTRRKAR